MLLLSGTLGLTLAAHTSETAEARREEVIVVKEVSEGIPASKEVLENVLRVLACEAEASSELRASS